MHPTIQPTGPSQASFTTEVREYTLDNGLTVWLNEDHSRPKVFGAVVVKAGSKESPNTGIAHYFEHMMFKGTEKIGTINYELEKVFLDLIEEKYDELAMTKDPYRRNIIQQKINELSIEAANYVIPNEFDKLTTKYGGSNLNAGTSYDYTVYHNVFSPQYFAQWAEINSERLLNPVFRMFQSELETVYEEKNHRDDMMLNQAIDRLMERYFHPHPYAYPILGSTENLKNPRLSEMRKFFEAYYVASNMGIILSGDFDSTKVIPILARTFSRIPQGAVEPIPTVKIAPFQGREKTIIRIPIPLLKAVALGFRGVPANHPDKPALDIALGLLNNPNGTGYLDRLMANRKVMGAIIGGECFNEAGFIGIMVVPHLSQSCYLAEKRIWKAIDHVKKGLFSDELFNCLKLGQLRKHITALEDIDSRSQVFVRLFSQGKTWDDYHQELKRAEALTKEDIIKIANKYFGDNYIFAKKKTGRYSNEYLSKPNYAPIVPPQADAVSDYAKKLEEMPTQPTAPRFIDFEHDVQHTRLNDHTTLYVTENRVNNIFTLKLSFGIGTSENPRIKLLGTYIPLLGTYTVSHEQFRLKLHTIGSDLDFDVDKDGFHVKVTGFDKTFHETFALVSQFLRQVKAEDRKLKTLVDDAKVSRKAFLKSNNEVAETLFEYVQYGNHSQYLTKPTYNEIKRMKGEELVALFHQVQQVACTIHYCGTYPMEEVSKIVRDQMALDRITQPSRSPICREFVKYEKPLVFFYDMPDVFQNIIYTYMASDPLENLRERHEAYLFSKYFGEGMSSLMFQEIREFRSFAYYTSGAYRLPPLCHADTPTRFVAYLSTQADKTTDALSVLDALIHDMPERPEKIKEVIQTSLNNASNDYPSFRELSTRIADYRRDGYQTDPRFALLKDLEHMSIEEVVAFYRSKVQARPLVYVVVGNSKKIDMRQLASFGDIVRMHKNDFHR